MHCFMEICFISMTEILNLAGCRRKPMLIYVVVMLYFQNNTLWLSQWARQLSWLQPKLKEVLDDYCFYTVLATAEPIWRSCKCELKNLSRCWQDHFQSSVLHPGDRRPLRPPLSKGSIIVWSWSKTTLFIQFHSLRTSYRLRRGECHDLGMGHVWVVIRPASLGCWAGKPHVR